MVAADSGQFMPQTWPNIRHMPCIEIRAGRTSRQPGGNRSLILPPLNFPRELCGGHCGWAGLPFSLHGPPSAWNDRFPLKPFTARALTWGPACIKNQGHLANNR